MLRNENRQKFVGCRQENGYKSPDCYDAARIERRRGRRDAALRNRARKRARERPYRTSTLEPTLERTPRLRLDRLKNQIGCEEERKQKQGLVDELYHAGEIASHGHCAAHAPQSTHLSGSIE